MIRAKVVVTNPATFTWKTHYLNDFEQCSLKKKIALVVPMLLDDKIVLWVHHQETCGYDYLYDVDNDTYVMVLRECDTSEVYAANDNVFMFTYIDVELFKHERRLLNEWLSELIT